MLLGLTRFLPIPVAPVLLSLAALTLLALIALAHFLSRTASRRDPASLLAALALATSDTGKSSNGSPISVYLRPRRKGIIVIEPDRVIGVVGDYAREYFLWVAAQLRVQGLAPTLVAACDASGSAATTPRLIWAKTVEELGAHPSLILRSYPIAGTLWCDEVAALLAISSEAVLPNHVSFEELYGEPEMVSIKNRWNNAPDQSLKLGRTADGTAFSLDLIRDGPHALVVGGTGSGKSEFLTTLVFALAATYPPNRLRLLLIDYKGGAGLLSSASLPHVERLLTDLDGSQTPWLLRILTAEIRRRKSLLLRAGFRSIAQWNGTPGCQSSPPPLLVVVADEVRALADRSPELLKQLTDIATQGRSLGIHLIAATQRPGGTVSSDLRAVLDVRVALRCSEVSDSVDVVGSREAADLPRVPGRAVINLGSGNRTVQSALVGNAEQWISQFRLAHEPEGADRLLPSPLPESIPFGSLSSCNDENCSAIGAFEERLRCEAKDLVWDGRPMLMTTSPVLARQVGETAIALASTSTAGHIIWAGLGGPRGERCCNNYGDVLRLIESELTTGEDPSTRQPATIIIPDLSTMLQSLQSAVGVERANEWFTRLLELAETTTLRLICVAISGGSFVERFPWRMFRFSSADQITSPRIAAYMPGELSGERPRPSQLVSDHPRRVVVTLPDGSSVYAQLVEPAPTDVARPLTLAQPIEGRPGLSGMKVPVTDPRKAALVVISADPSMADPVAVALGGADRFESIEHVDPSGWTRIVPSPHRVTAAIEPSRELTRWLTTGLGASGAWALASLPFPQQCGFVCYGTKIGTLVL